MSRQSGRSQRSQASRQRLLDVGRAMVLNAPSSDLLDHIRLSEVARRAGVSTGALYHYWDSQDDYRAELLGQILSPAPYSLQDSIETQVREAAAGGISLHELIKAVCAANTEQFFGNADFRLQVALWLNADSDVAHRLAAQYEAVAQEWVEFYRTVFEVYGLRLRTPFTFPALAAVLTALLEGLMLRVAVDPLAGPLGTSEDEAGWDLFSCTVLALLPGVTEEIESEPLSLWKWSRDRVANSGDGSLVGQ
ncbi:MAG: TetR/AcrR family transcriptional regulator [Acidimicrobiales bacterium]|nr:TetR/AcrR family transcriptional regulator [Acidimicrobiales bacterium]